MRKRERKFKQESYEWRHHFLCFMRNEAMWSLLSYLVSIWVMSYDKLILILTGAYVFRYVVMDVLHGMGKGVVRINFMSFVQGISSRFFFLVFKVGLWLWTFFWTLGQSWTDLKVVIYCFFMTSLNLFESLKIRLCLWRF